MRGFCLGTIERNSGDLTVKKFIRSMAMGSRVQGVGRGVGFLTDSKGRQENRTGTNAAMGTYRQSCLHEFQLYLFPFHAVSDINSRENN